MLFFVIWTFSYLLQFIGSGELRRSEWVGGKKAEEAQIFWLPKSSGVIVSFRLWGPKALSVQEPLKLHYACVVC